MLNQHICRPWSLLHFHICSNRIPVLTLMRSCSAYNLGTNLNDTVERLKVLSKSVEKALTNGLTDDEYCNILMLKASSEVKAKIWSSSPELENFVHQISDDARAQLMAAGLWQTETFLVRRIPVSSWNPQTFQVRQEKPLTRGQTLGDNGDSGDRAIVVPQF